MTERYVISGQAAGFISLNGPVLDVSDYSAGTNHKLTIPAGILNIGGNGRGFVIEENLAYIFTPPLSTGTYVMYASTPSSPTGIAVINHDTYSNYTAGGGDDSNRRAFCYFVVSGTSPSVIQPSSIKTFNNFDYENIYTQLQKMGFYFNKQDFNFTYRGQYYDEEVTFETGVATGDLVYKNSSGNYDQAISDDTDAEKVIGIAELHRNEHGTVTNIHEGNFVIASGFIDVGITILPDADFPVGTFLYLSGSTAGLMVRDFNHWIANNAYTENNRIAEGGWILKATNSGQSQDPGPPNWASISAVGDTIVDGGVTWESIAIHDPVFIPDTETSETSRKIRVGIALGSGVVLLQSGASLIDDHDESSYAHRTIQLALEKAGIFVVDTSQGKTVSPTDYRGQAFDEQAVFSGVGNSVKALVYRHSDGNYQLALANDTVAENVIGMSWGVGEDDYASLRGMVLSSGFLSMDTSGYNPGDEVYLHAANGGEFTSSDTGIRIGTIIIAAVEASGGLLSLQIGNSNELDDHNEGTNSHDNFLLAMQKAGIYVASSPYSHDFVGQNFDENAVFGSGANGEPVYVVSNAGPVMTYGQAIADGSTASIFMGVAIDISNALVASQGYINVGTTLLPTITYPAGTTVYLSDTVAGTYSVTTTQVRVGISLGEGILLLTSIGTTSNVGDVTFEDVNYSILFKDLHFNKVYYDIFEEVNSVDTVSGATYDATAFTYDGTSTDYIEHEITLGGSYSRFMLHVEAEDTADITAEIDYGSGLISVNLDDDFYTPSNETLLTIRLTWGSGPGTLNSFGLFYDYGDPAFALARLYETYVLTGDVAVDDDITLPNSAQYIANGNSLEIYRNGLRMELTQDYTEVDSRTIKVKTIASPGGWYTDDRLIFVESYTQVDVSEDNTTKLNFEHNETGEHVLEDKVTGQLYRIEIHNGVIQAVPYSV